VVEAWRIVKQRYAEHAFEGEGARRFGGRWNSPGRPVVYVSESRALATLEILAGLGTTGPLPAWVMIGVRFPEAIVAGVEDLLDEEGLPDGWDAAPPEFVSQGIGDRWLDEATSAVLRVPSVIIPAESNFLLNPRHSEFKRIEIGEPEELRLDPRLSPGPPP
jgi:RES domain-containing protein